jgi:outer membrane lipoprotein SlyB
MKMPIHSISTALLGVLSAAALAACNSVSDPTNPKQSIDYAGKSMIAPKCYDCGTIASIEEMKMKGSGTGVGAVAGAVVGGVVGHQIGDGRGQDIATVVGAVGGGFAGNEIEKRVKGTSYFHVTVAMENGGTRTVDVDALNGLTTGSRVKIVGANLQVAAL